MFNINNKKILIAGGIGILIVLFLVIINTSQNKGLDAFAKSYASFRNQEYETIITGYFSIMNTSSESGKKNYFTYMAKATNTQQSNAFRAKNAQQALSAYKTRRQLYMDNFAENINKLDSATSLLVETANMIKNNDYMNTATKIAQYAREIQQNYESMNIKYSEHLNLQTSLLKTLVDNGGNIYSSTSIVKLKKAGTRIPILNNEIDNLAEKTIKISQKMDDLYLSLKGKAGLKDYKNKFTKDIKK